MLSNYHLGDQVSSLILILSLKFSVERNRRATKVAAVSERLSKPSACNSSTSNSSSSNSSTSTNNSCRTVGWIIIWITTV